MSLILFINSRSHLDPWFKRLIIYFTLFKIISYCLYVNERTREFTTSVLSIAVNYFRPFQLSIFSHFWLKQSLLCFILKSNHNFGTISRKN